ncbi:hypothetical protein ACTWLI_14840 [Arthrobacter sp. Hor0625]|uniref:hypothetical protein n=1 Tax=Arthrobacter sp. Hor0625 TaxID=3457358 RepID=UPI00403EAC9A
MAWSKTLGDQVPVIDAADPSTPGIDMFAVPGDEAAKSTFFVNAMRYTFGREAIRDRFFETRTGVVTPALAIDQALLDSRERQGRTRHPSRPLHPFSHGLPRTSGLHAST